MKEKNTYKCVISANDRGEVARQKLNELNNK